MRVRLAGPSDFAGFRREARALLARRVPPQQVHWVADPAHEDLFAAGQAPQQEAEAPEARVAVPAAFLALCQAAALHREPQRFALLYRLLWRLVHEPALRHDPLDPDLLQARRLAQAVHRDLHKMRAFVRFRIVDDGGDEPLHVAWFEPDHHVVEANAPWFRRRFANMRWAILTPECCVEWDRRELRTRAGARRDETPPADAAEQLWLTYYRSIFNPARLKLEMMRKEMPQRYWRNLPEAQLIAPLAAQALERSGRMIERAPEAPLRRLPRAQAPLRRLPRAQAPVPAATADDLPDLQARIASCARSPLGVLATQAVPGEGPLRPRLMFVGEQPGDQEDLAGRPFVGPAGRLFDRALAQAGLERRAVYVTNAVRHFKHELRGKRRIHKTPGQQEVLACRRWLEEEIALVQPRALVALGGTAARALLGRAVAVRSQRGQWLQRNDGLPVLVMLHPSALLRMDDAARPQALREFVTDLVTAAGR